MRTPKVKPSSSVGFDSWERQINAKPSVLSHDEWNPRLWLMITPKLKPSAWSHDKSQSETVGFVARWVKQSVYCPTILLYYNAKSETAGARKRRPPPTSLEALPRSCLRRNLPLCCLTKQRPEQRQSHQNGTRAKKKKKNVSWSVGCGWLIDYWLILDWLLIDCWLDARMAFDCWLVGWLVGLVDWSNRWSVGRVVMLFFSPTKTSPVAAQEAVEKNNTSKSMNNMTKKVFFHVT